MDLTAECWAYFWQVLDENPDLTKEEVKNICKAHFSEFAPQVFFSNGIKAKRRT